MIALASMVLVGTLVKVPDDIIKFIQIERNADPRGRLFATDMQQRTILSLRQHVFRRGWLCTKRRPLEVGPGTTLALTLALLIHERTVSIVLSIEQYN